MMFYQTCYRREISGLQSMSAPVDDYIRWRDSLGSDWNRENPVTGYDHRITASTFLPFFEVFPLDPTRTLSPG
jgi:hypothetical protein